MKVGTIILKVGFVMMTETTLQFYLMLIQPFLSICMVCAILRTRGGENVSLISARKDTRTPGQEGQPYLRVIKESLKTVTANESKVTKSRLKAEWPYRLKPSG